MHQDFGFMKLLQDLFKYTFVSNLSKFYMVQLHEFTHFIESKLFMLISIWLCVVWFCGLCILIWVH